MGLHIEPHKKVPESLKGRGIRWNKVATSLWKGIARSEEEG